MTDIYDLRRAAEGIEARLSKVGDRLAQLMQMPRDRLDGDAIRAGLGEAQRLRQDLVLLRNRYLVLTVGGAVPRAVLSDPAETHRRMALQHYFNEAFSRVHVWQQIERAAAQLILGERRPLYPSRNIRDTIWAEQEGAMDTALLALHRLVNPTDQSADAEEHGCFADIPLRPSTFVGHAHAAARVAMAQRRPRPLRFLDVGCGGGVKLLMAAEFFEIVEGLEYDPAYAAAARAMLATVNQPACSVTEGDGLTFDRYAEFDVIYFYRPMKDQEALERLEARIVAQARPGTILIAPYDQFRTSAEHLDCVQIDDVIHVTGLSGAEAEALRVEAEKTGPYAYNTRDRIDPRAANLASLVNACRAMGFHP